MKYAIVCNLDGDFALYQKGLVREIAEKFDIVFPFKQKIEPHFTLKYSFETDSIKDVEAVIENFCTRHTQSPIKAGGFNSFRKDVIFIEIKLSDEARKVFLEFINELKKISWLDWRDNEGEKLNFHCTIATDCEKRFDEISEYLKGKEKRFDCQFDNITIIQECSIFDDVMTWETHKKFTMN